MTKRYISSFISLRYAVYMPMLAMAVFVCTFIYGSKGLMIFKWIGGGFGFGLLILMFFYYREKLQASKFLRDVKNLDAFDDAVMIGQTFFLEDRMLSFSKGKLMLSDYSDLKQAVVVEGLHGKLIMSIDAGVRQTDIQLATVDQGCRVAAFLQTKNPAISFIGTEVKGEGTLHSIDPYRNEK